MLATSRILFILGIMYSVAFFTLTLHDVHIDTRLDDLSPKTSQTANTRTAINALVEYSERKLIIGIVGNTVEQVDGASEQLRNKLTQTQGLSIHNITDKQQKIIDLIKPYRFHLLSQKQQNKLNTASDQALVLDAQKKLYQLGANLSLITFNEDPLGWFNEYLIKQLETLEQNTVNATTTPIAFELITVNLTADAMEVSTQKQLQQALTTLETDIARTFSVQFLHSGVFFFAADAATKSQQDIERISAGSIAATLLLLLFVFRSLSPLILPFLSIALGVSFAFAVSHTLYGSVHMLTIIFGASLIGIVIDYSLHFFCHQLAAHKNYENHKKLYRALLLSMLTSVIAYGALSFSGIEALKKVAVFSCAGLIMAWLCVVVIGPLLVFKKPALSKKNHYALFNQFANRVSLPKKIQLSIITGILLLPLLLLSLNKIHLSDDPRLFFQASANLLAQEQQLRNLSKSYEPGRYLLLNGKQSDDIYRNFEKVLAAYKTEKQQEIEFYTAMNFIPAAGQQQQNYQLQARLYEKNGVTTQLLSALDIPTEVATSLTDTYTQAQTLHLNPAIFINTIDGFPPLWLETTEGITSLLLIPSTADHTLLQTISEKLTGVNYISQLQDARQSLSKQRQSASALLGLVFVLLAVLITLYHRSLKATALLLVPLTGVAAAISCLTITGQTLTLFHIMALFLVVGLGMDYVIFTQEMREEKNRTQQAIILSALTSLLSFGLLSLSIIPVAQAFGMTVLIGNSVNLLAALNYSQFIEPS